MKSTALRTLTALAGVAFVAGALAGCTGGDDSTAKKSASPKPSTAPSQVTEVSDAPGTGEGFEGARNDVEVKKCEPADGGWAISGTVTNSSEATANYRIYVSLLDKDSATLGLKQVNSDGVEAGKSADWNADIAVDGKNLQCVLRVERYPAS
ncbi:hypothetical protein GCM10027515_06170 [Schumannella luteola]|uniref:Secreted protein n=1 Tax=Schumannella luteola TaxID=472059 RepID=A0A852YAM6_9MICO|nr:FxLYD domain-containing protein [Schumannella luteola]NYG98251.1 hypothetical protein [Schumannella luteola]TPX02134.1 hypothetical protein FJ656_23800 [Schumannella luteola]